jgi:hypothetical protein
MTLLLLAVRRSLFAVYRPRRDQPHPPPKIRNSTTMRMIVLVDMEQAPSERSPPQGAATRDIAMQQRSSEATPHSTRDNRSKEWVRGMSGET